LLARMKKAVFLLAASWQDPRCNNLKMRLAGSTLAKRLASSVKS
jgi:hypothetical protein